ncbi:DUF4034 domain-containing protein [Aestuariibius insulae]|uniref:DUF4034 domain-containing protein n=1 Tax=Aestuariibius insulae TaxID=2058287 RepID=UPI00345E8881
MRRFILSILFISALAGPGEADPILDEVRDFIDTRDYDELERTFEAEYQLARETGEFSDIRDAFGIIFASAHPERLKAVQIWMERHPGSKHAKTASAWQHYQLERDNRRAFRGGVSSPGLMLQVAGHKNKRARLAREVFESDPEYLPASDALLISPRPFDDEFSLGVVLDQALEARPSIRSINLAMTEAIRPEYNDFDRRTRICLAYADRVPTYSVDLCTATIIAKSYGAATYREDAVALVLAARQPDLNHVRHETILRYFGNQGLVDIDEDEFGEVRRLHLRAAKWKGWREYVGGTVVLADKMGDPFLRSEAFEAKLAMAEQFVIDNPTSAYYIREYIGFRHYLEQVGMSEAMTDADREDMRRLWKRGLSAPPINSEYWQMATYLSSPDDGIEHNYALLKPILEQMIVLEASFPINPVSQFFRTLNRWHHDIEKAAAGIGEDVPEPVWQAIQCDRLAMARLVTEICKSDGRGDYYECRDDGYSASSVARKILSSSDELGSCPYVMNSPIRALLPDLRSTKDISSSGPIADW